jgi:predicted DNA-binding transcriptional regulator AlpA
MLSTPALLTAPEVADVLRKTPAAIYKMVERDQIPSAVVIRLGRKVYFHRASLLDWLDQMRAARLAE